MSIFFNHTKNLTATAKHIDQSTLWQLARCLLLECVVKHSIRLSFNFERRNCFLRANMWNGVDGQFNDYVEDLSAKVKTVRVSICIISLNSLCGVNFWIVNIMWCFGIEQGEQGSFLLIENLSLLISNRVFPRICLLRQKCHLPTQRRLPYDGAYTQTYKSEPS